MSEDLLTNAQIKACRSRIEKLKQDRLWATLNWFNDGDFNTALNTIEQLQAALDKANEENGSLKEFARKVIRQECWSLFPQDGGDLQEVAEKLGLIVPHIATKDDVGDECDFEAGDKIFKFSDVLKE